jgi:hypothetical protein
MRRPEIQRICLLKHEKCAVVRGFTYKKAQAFAVLFVFKSATEQLNLT